MINKFIKGTLKDKTFIKDSTILFIASTVSNGILFLINLLLSRMFEPSLFGSFKTTLYLFSLLGGLLDFGIIYTLPKFIAEFRGNKRNKIGSMILWFVKLRLILFLMLISVLFIFKTQITTLFLHNPALESFTIAGIFIIFCYFFVFLKSIVSGYENFTLLSLSLVVPSVVFGILGFVSAYYLTPVYTIFAYAISIFIGSIICLPFILKQRLLENSEKFNLNEVFFNYSLPMYLINIPLQLGLSITPILSIFFSQELIGYFSFAFMFYFTGSSVSSTLAAVLFPKVSRLNGQRKHVEVKKSLTRAFIIYTAVVVAGTIGVLLFSKLFMEIFALRYLPGLTMFKVIVISGLVLGYFNIMGSYYAAVAKIKETAILTILQNVILFAICYFLLATF